ncbi:T9SS type A sorting domain-containing protein [Ferruginibacter albus]|uniref:T9SS type A sorting domain-containing protein n=1 Tax=Ferruginibacter albus TaxID=2875540 RepID=UPI001CC74D63|nr:T9SS type A sorting domain-containing protein [Ferruginibacter albus]UAY52024.1 T9SS type A sorting domain-containing protein [Ferruginibacter albus]
MLKLYFLLFISFLFSSTLIAQSPHAAQLYGVTTFGGNNYLGSIFHYTPGTNIFTTDYSFERKVQGATPKCKIVAPGNGKYYGTTTSGGNYNAGVIFVWDSATNEYTEPYHFTGIDGNDARGEMIEYDHKFYGITNLGGTNNAGVIYEWDYSNNVYTKKIDLDNASGSNPDGTLTLIGNKFYGFTHTGGQYNKGVLFEWDVTSNTYTKKFDFDSTKGSNPVGKLVPFNGKLYAMCNAGGSSNMGTLYEWDYVTNTVTKKVDFTGTNGSHPLGFLSFYNNNLYATTYDGGTHNYGVIFQYNPTSNTYTKKLDMGFVYYPQLGNIRTVYPLGSLTLKGNIFWGVTSNGNSAGAIFSYDPATNVFSDYFFNNSSGYPVCDVGLTTPAAESYESFLVSGNMLLGTYSSAGVTYTGCIFKFLPDSNQFVSAVHMGAADGLYPNTYLTKLNNKLFGVTATGGYNHNGTIFEYDLTTHQYQTRFEFDGYKTGLQPTTSLTYCNGKFYGINSRGRSFKGSIGVGNTQTFASGWTNNRSYGEIYSWDPVSNLYQNISYNDVRQGLNVYPGATFINYNNKLYTIQPESYTDTATKILASGTVKEYDPIIDSFKDRAIIKAVEGNPFNANGISYYNGKFYGMTMSGGTGYGKGAMIYEWDTTTRVAVRKVILDSIGGFVPYGSLTLAGNEFYGITSNYGSGPSPYSVLFKWNPATNVLKKCSQLAYRCFGNPTYSEGKIYFASATNLTVLDLYAYDPVLDTSYWIREIPTNPGNWNKSCTAPNFYTQLVEVIPNQAPLLSNTPGTLTVCTNEAPHTTNFTLSDADNDSMLFRIASSNTALIPKQNILITHTDSTYTITYTSSANQTGVSIISVIANDGYGDSVNFSFKVNVIASNQIICTPVPIKLLSFTAQAKEKNVLISWQTTAEINLKEYTIERSTDGITFTKIALVNASNDNSYSFIDEYPYSGTNYYRLKSIDNNGEYTYSDIAKVSFQFSQYILTVYPNPVKEILYINANSSIKNIHAVITDITGRKMSEGNYSVIH